MEPTHTTGEPGVRRQQITVVVCMIVSSSVAALIWTGVDDLLPPLAGMANPLNRLVFALDCCCVATLLCFFAGTEAIAHDRMNSKAIDPLSGNETPRMKVNLRYLQQTLEQLIVFAVGLLALAVYCPDGASMRSVVAATLVWIVSRWALWIGYHFGARFRAIGLAGMVQSLLVLVYVCGRFGYGFGGMAGAAAVLVPFAGIEAYLVYLGVSGARKTRLIYSRQSI